MVGNTAKRATVSLAGFALICFFMPWVQVSCLGAKDAVSGFQLARDGSRPLWLIPALLVTVLLLGLIRGAANQMPALFALSGMVAGSVGAWLMYHERSSTEAAPHLIATFWTPWYWLGLGSSLLVAASALWFYAGRARPP